MKTTVADCLLNRRHAKTYGDQQSWCLPEAFKHLYLDCGFFLTKAPNFPPTHIPFPFGPAIPKYSSSLTQWAVSYLCCPMFCLPRSGLPGETSAISELTYLETSPECSGQSQPPPSLCPACVFLAQVLWLVCMITGQLGTMHVESSPILAFLGSGQKPYSI